MKRISIILLTVSVLAGGCGKFLEQAPVTSVYEEMAVGSEAALEADMMSIYDGLSFWASNQFFYYLCSASKMQEYTGTRKTEDFLQGHDLTMYSITSSNQGMYTNLYRSVGRCNTLLATLPESPVAASYKKEVEAEARFMRALFYFTLARFYGDLPYMTEPCRTEEDAFVKRTGYTKIYELIVSDLLFAADNMRDKARQEAVNPGRGRSSKMAAKALLANVYMQMACYMQNPEDQFFDCSKPGRLPDFSGCGVFSARQAWEKCLEAAEDVITSKVYDLEPDYRHLYRWDPDNYPEDYMSRERIITFQASPISVKGGIVPWMLWDNPSGTLSNYIHNGNAGRIRASRWVFQNWCARHGGVKETLGGYEIYTYTDDPRFDASYFHSEVWGVPAGTSSTAGRLVRTEIYPTEGKIKTEASADPYIRKYFSPAYQCDNGDADFYVLRFAEVLLTAAEASAALSSGPGDELWNKSIDYINLLFARARASYDEGQPVPENPKDWNYTDFTTKDELLQAIFWERAFELGNEGHEWFDSHRQGATWLSENICKPLNIFNHLPENVSLWAQFYNSQDLKEDPQTLRSSLLLAFPEYELRYNNALSLDDQNDFYVK